MDAKQKLIQDIKDKVSELNALIAQSKEHNLEVSLLQRPFDESQKVVPSITETIKY